MRKTFHQEGHEVRAVDDVSLVLRRGETLGLVGESGSGKTTLARALLGLTAADQGSVIELDGRPLADGDRQARRASRSRGADRLPEPGLGAEPALLGAPHPQPRARPSSAGDKSDEREGHLRELVESVRFDVRLINSRPAQLSGGLKQRVAIARAFAGEPRVVVCDEPTSALDVSVQAAILNLLAELQSDKGVSYLFISHDLAVVRYLSDRIAVLYLGRVMELGESETVFTAPHHPYTEALLSSVPQIDGLERPRIRLEGEIPSHADPPSGCVFHTRCPRFIGDVCVNEEPPLREVEPDHLWRCHHSLEALRELQKTAPPDAAERWPGRQRRGAGRRRGAQAVAPDARGGRPGGRRSGGRGPAARRAAPPPSADEP